ncbi:S-Ena type endospore appendage [Halalkalibacter sp. AB-rgal2]|uniref:S-Ena type endospore appendage n=1 Tax=Halalkalibacter sp. AB-rgal2 TaxID=3242695 RepID=UPI00359D992F
MDGNEINGIYQISCGETVTIWSTRDSVPIGTVSIYYGDGCTSTLEVIVIFQTGEQHIFSVPQYNTRSRTLTNIVEVQLSCQNGTSPFPCTGQYCISIHHPIKNKQLALTPRSDS